MYNNVDDHTPPSLWQRIVLPNLCYNVAVLALLITTVVLSANTLGRVEKEATTCRLRYEGNANDLTEQQFQAFAKSAGWTLTHPEAPDCNRCKEPDRFPVWMAPVDICRAFNLDVDNHPLCNSQTGQLEASHLKVCATQTQIDKAWADGGCHSGSGNETQPFLGYDGALFCKQTFSCHSDKCHNDGAIRYNCEYDYGWKTVCYYPNKQNCEDTWKTCYSKGNNMCYMPNNDNCNTHLTVFSSTLKNYLKTRTD